VAALTVPARGSETIAFDFDLNTSPGEMLPHPAELRIRYRTGDRDLVASTMVEKIGGYHQPRNIENGNEQSR
jgi:hypothetical protein